MYCVAVFHLIKWYKIRHVIVKRRRPQIASQNKIQDLKHAAKMISLLQKYLSSKTENKSACRIHSFQHKCGWALHRGTRTSQKPLREGTECRFLVESNEYTRISHMHRPLTFYKKDKKIPTWSFAMND